MRIKKRKGISKVMYDGIQFDSSLEVYCYKKLKAAGFSFSYNQHTFELVKGFTANSDSYEPDKRTGKEMALHSNRLMNIKYTPDFIGDWWIIETKGRKNESFPMRWKLFRRYLLEQGLHYTLFMPRNQSHVDQAITIINERSGVR